jgi:hypothetical protein
VAKIRGGARGASRHSSRRGYGRGYQYSYPQPFNTSLGPWSSVWPLGNRNVPPSALQTLYNGVLRDGAVYAIWKESTSTISNRFVIGEYEFGLLDKTYRFTFYLDADDSNKLKVTYHDGTSGTTVDTTLTPSSTSHVVAAPYQDKLYFSFVGATSVYVIDTTNDTSAAVSGSPAKAEFLLMINDVLVAVYISGSSYLFGWTVNANPQDWSGTGSGTNPIPGHLGRPQGLVKYNQDGLLLTSFGAVQVSATGRSSPAFGFASREEIAGVQWPHAVVSSGAKVFYIGRDRLLYIYDGQARTAGTGGKLFTNVVSMLVSERSKMVFISDPTDDESFMLGLDTLEWVSNKDAGWDWMTDAPGPSFEGFVYGIKNVGVNYDQHAFDLASITPTKPLISTGSYYVGREIWLNKIDLIRTEADSPAFPSLNLIMSYGRNQQATKTFETPSSQIENEGEFVTYRPNHPAKVFAIEIGGTVSTGTAAQGPWLLDDINTAGNVPIDATNPSAGVSAELSAGDNATVSDEGDSLIGDEVNINGNLLMSLNPNSWNRNRGLERIEIYASEMASNERQIVGSSP